MKKLIFLFVITSAIITSCTITKLVEKNTNSHDYQVNANQTSLFLRPLMADLSIENIRKEVTYTNQNIFSFDDLKANSMQLFLKTHSCDYVVDPLFSITKTTEKSKIKEITIILSGYPAKYTKIYQVDSLPKSVFQGNEINKSQKRLNYINSIENDIIQNDKLQNDKSHNNKSQMTFGLNLGLLKPLKGSSSNQYGANLILKYNFNNFLFGINAGYYFYDSLSFSKVLFTIPVTGSIEYSFFNSKFSPYIGTDLGYYLFGSFDKTIGTTTKGNFGIAPCVGLNFNISDKLLLNCNFKYHNIYRELENISMIGINVGIFYKFN